MKSSLDLNLACLAKTPAPPAITLKKLSAKAVPTHPCFYSKKLVSAILVLPVQLATTNLNASTLSHLRSVLNAKVAALTVKT
jgi:hypothetical protein